MVPIADTGKCLYVISGTFTAVASTDSCPTIILSSRSGLDGIVGSLIRAWIWLSLVMLLAGLAAWNLGLLKVARRTVVRDAAKPSPK